MIINMKRSIIIVAMLACVCANANVQSMLERIGQRAKQAVENKVGEAVENAIDNGIDKATKKKGNAEEAKPSESVEAQEASPEVQAAPEVQTEPAVQAEPVKKAETAYAKSDFVPGDEIIFDDDFANEQLGEFPSKWDVRSGNAEVATIDGRAKNRRVEFVKK